MDTAQRRQRLANFLRTCRTRLSPNDVNLPVGRRRRTTGLRREELAQLANIGVSWYTSIEQGRNITPSLEVLDSLATALRLSEVERRHLFHLAGYSPIHTPNDQNENISPILHRVLDDLNPNPTYVMDRRWNLVAWNTAAEHIFKPRYPSPPYDYNILWRVFAYRPDANKYEQWVPVAQKILAEFRAESTRYADDEWLQQLIADLQRISPEFRDWWPSQDVRDRIDGNKDLDHPLVGRLCFEHTTLQLTTPSDMKVMIYRPRSGTDTAQKVQQILAIETRNEHHK